MQNITQPFAKLTAANAEILMRFAQSPEVAELASAGAQKYLELAQQSFGRVATSEAYSQLVRRLTENYSTFMREYSESLMGVAAEGQSLLTKQLQDASGRLAEAGESAVANASAKVKHSRGR